MKKSEAIFQIADIIKEYRLCRATTNVDLARYIIDRLGELGMSPPETKVKMNSIFPDEGIEVRLDVWDKE